MNELNNKLDELNHIGDGRILATKEELLALFSEQVRLGKDEVLDELLEWHEYWSNQHEKPFNWYGAVKALKVSKDFKKPFNVLPTTDTTLLEGGSDE